MALDELTNTGTARPPTSRALVECTIATTPATMDEEVYVLIDGNPQRVGPCRWMPRIDPAGDPVTPSRGDDATVAFSDRGHAQVMWWQPA